MISAKQFLFDYLHGVLRHISASKMNSTRLTVLFVIRFQIEEEEEETTNNRFSHAYKMCFSNCLNRERTISFVPEIVWNE